MRCGCIIAGVAALGVVMLSPCGCTIGLDLINPDLLTQMGLDVNAINPPPGTVVVMFTNHSQGQATFHAFEVPNVNNPSQGARNFSVQVQPGQSDNEVLTCPVNVVGLGSLGADYGIASTVAVDVVGGSGSGTVNYTGAPLVSPADYSCGDLISVELSPDGLTVSVQVVPS